VVETHSSPALLAAVDAAIKSTPVKLSEIRLGDDLGGHALALMSGDLSDVEIALDICSERAGDQLLARTLLPRLDPGLRSVLDQGTERAGDQLLARTLLPRLDPGLRSVLDQGTRFGLCAAYEPAGAEFPEEVACSWDA